MAVGSIRQGAGIIKFMQDKPAPAEDKAAKNKTAVAISSREFMQDSKNPEKVGDQSEKVGFMQDNKAPKEAPKAKAEFMQDNQKKSAAYDRSGAVAAAEGEAAGQKSVVADLKI